MHEDGVNLTSSIKAPQHVLMPAYRKPNPGYAAPKKVAAATATPYITLNLSKQGYIYYSITDYNGNTGSPHGAPGSTLGATISGENKYSDLFSTQFPNGIKAHTIHRGSSKGEVKISGENHTWVSHFNTLLDDDTTWDKKQ